MAKFTNEELAAMGDDQLERLADTGKISTVDLVTLKASRAGLYTDSPCVSVEKEDQ
jgi:hypothetical protein